MLIEADVVAFDKENRDEQVPHFSREQISTRLRQVETGRDRVNIKLDSSR